MGEGAASQSLTLRPPLPAKEGENDGEPNAIRGRILTALAVFILSLALLMATDGLFGITYDEPIYQSKSLQAFEWLRLLALSPTLAASREGVDLYWHAKDAHPGFMKLLSAVCGATLGRLVAPDAALRTGTNLLCALCFAALHLFVASLWGRAAGLYAVGALLLMPRVFGDAHLAALDAPVMAMTLLTLAATWWACMAPGTRIRSVLFPGLLWGLALGVKLNAFFVPLVVFPWALVFARRRVLPLALSYAVLGPLAFFSTWPWLWHDTWTRFVEYFQFHFRHWEISVLYFGRIYQVAPWHYPLVMTAITVPPVTLLLAVCGLGRLRRMPDAFREPGRPQRQAAALALVVWGLVVNFVPSCLPSTPKYNGVRLFLPVFPLLAVLAAVGWRALLDRLQAALGGRLPDREARLKLTALAAFAALIGPFAVTARFTPYQLSYYNVFIGGLPGATRAGMEPTYWGDTYRSAALWLAQRAEHGATVWIEPPGFESTVRLFELGPLRPDLRFSAGPAGIADSDYAVTQNKPTEWTDITRRLIASSTPVYTDGVDGVPLIYVFKLR